MPLIQIEQDSPQVIQRARDQIAYMVEGQNELPDDLSHCYGRSARLSGYLAALMVEHVISMGQYMELLGEAEAVDRVQALAQDL